MSDKQTIREARAQLEAIFIMQGATPEWAKKKSEEVAQRHAHRENRKKNRP